MIDIRYDPDTGQPIIFSDGPVVLTGPTQGPVTLPSGEVVDVTAAAVEARDEAHAAEIAHAIGLHWAAPENIHPGQRDVDEDGQPRLREFVYDDSHYQAANSVQEG